MSKFSKNINMANYGNQNGGSAATRKKLSSSEYNTVYRRKSSPHTMKKWIEYNKKEYGDEITALKEIVNKQVLDAGNSDTFTSDMLVALISGRKITPKMENAINNIIIRNSPEEMNKRNDWVERVVPKIIMVREMISDTSWTTGYRGETHNFINSVIEQAKSRKTLSKKQMEAVNKVYLKCKKNIDKNKKKRK
tara:strand:+ start:111 stop:689 length:579 start_codon:yes stop_codon:yes gene_type:complete